MMVQVVIRMPWRPMYLASPLDRAGDIRAFVRIPRNTRRSKFLSISEFSRRGLIVTEVPSSERPDSWRHQCQYVRRWPPGAADHYRRASQARWKSVFGDISGMAPLQYNTVAQPFTKVPLRR